MVNFVHEHLVETDSHLQISQSLHNYSYILVVHFTASTIWGLQKLGLVVIVGYDQCWESQIFFLLRKAQIRNENWIRLLRIRKCKAFAPQ